jgi:hypothetical protein
VTWLVIALALGVCAWLSMLVILLQSGDSEELGRVKEGRKR